MPPQSEGQNSIRLPSAGLWSRIDNRLAGLGIDPLPDIGLDEIPAGYIVDLVRLALQHPEDRIASGMDQALDRAAVALQVDEHRRIDLVPIPGIVLVVLVIGRDLAGVGIEREHGAGIEIVAGMRPPGQGAALPTPQ